MGLLGNGQSPQRLGEEDLRFQEEEISRFYQARGYSFPEEELKKVESYTEGWAAAMSMENAGGDNALAALPQSSRDIEEYLHNEVLSTWKPERTGLEIHIENVYEGDFNLIRDLVDAVGNPKFTVCLDIGHVNSNSSKTLIHWICGLNDRIRYVHLHNNYGEFDDRFGRWKGQIDMLNTLECLKIHSPKALWTIETLSADIKPSIY